MDRPTIRQGLSAAYALSGYAMIGGALYSSGMSGANVAWIIFGLALLTGSVAMLKADK